MAAAMKMLVLACVLAAPVEAAGSKTTNAVTKVIQLISDLEAKILKEGTESTKVYEEYAEWCEDESKKLDHEIKPLKLEVEDLKAVIDKETTTAEEMTAKVEELTAAISVDEKDLKAAEEIRGKEHEDFVAEEAELSETISALEKAIGILTREMAKSGAAALVQLDHAGSVVNALKVLVQASSFPVADANRLTAFLQSRQTEQDGEMGAPDPAAYESKSGGIVATLEDLLDEAKTALDKARNKEAEDLNNFEVLVQTIKDEIKYAEKELAEANDNLAAAKEAIAAAEGDLGIATKTLNATLREKATLHQECMEKAQDYELEMKSRGEELKALAGAKKAISESVSFSQEAVSLLQTSRRLQTRADLSGVEATRLVRDLGRKLRAPAFSQLAARMERLLRGAATGGDDPFSKVKGLIRDMIAKLLKEAEEEAEEKAFCDKELGETRAKKEDKEDEIAKLTAAIDKATARIAQLTTAIKELQKNLAELAASQKKMDEIRNEEHTLYESEKAELEEGIQGVKLALKILKDYYGSNETSGSGAADGIIGLIEVIESDLTKELTDVEANEKTAAAENDAQTKENEIMKVTMDQDVKYKTKEKKDLQEALAEATSDRTAVQGELDAVLDYLKGIEARCIAKPMTYEERVKRRNAEINGLKEAMEILSGASAASLLEEGATQRRIRGRVA
jgi:chromosome segregation ATPase